MFQAQQPEFPFDESSGPVAPSVLGQCRSTRGAACEGGTTMTMTKTWKVLIFIGERAGRTHAEARLIPTDKAR